MAKFNFTKAFDEIGSMFVTALKNKMHGQKGIDGMSYSPPAPSTLRARRSLKGKAASASTKRLVVTNELANEGFGYTVKPNDLRVFVRPVSHKDGVSYDRIIEYNSRGQSRVNKNITNPPLVFPTNSSEILMMKKEVKTAMAILQDHANRQFKDKLNMKLKVVLRVG